MLFDYLKLYLHPTCENLTWLKKNNIKRYAMYAIVEIAGQQFKVEKDQKGYLEDRRPNANADPYVIATVMIDTVCSAASG